MTQSGSHPPAADPLGQFLVIGAYGAAASGFLSIPLVFAIDTHLKLSMGAALLGMSGSLICLLAAILRGRKNTRRSLERMAWPLSLPYLTSLPVFYIEGMGYGLGGDIATSNHIGTLLWGCIILFPTTIVLLGVLWHRSDEATVP